MKFYTEHYVVSVATFKRLSDFDKDNLFIPVVRHETVRMFLPKVGTKSRISNRADIENAYLYVEMERPSIMK